MIYEQHPPEQQDLSLFSNPEQLHLLREHLTHLIHRKQNCRYDTLYPNSTKQIQAEQQKSLSQLLHLQHQHEELIADLYFQISTLGQISIKMIDYIAQMQDKRVDEVLSYEDQIDNLKTQLEMATQKNSLIEGDIEMFRERLLVLQSEMEEVERNQPGQVCELQNQTKIDLLEHQLQKIKQQLKVCKTQSTSKEPETALFNRVMHTNMSEKLIQLRRPILTLPDAYIHSQEIAQLNHKIKMLQQQNYQLRYEMQCIRDTYCSQQLYIPADYNQKNPFEQEGKLEVNIQVLDSYGQTMSRATSSSVLRSPRKQQAQLMHNMVSYQSVEKFHTLSNEWSTKSFQHNIAIFNMDCLQNKLIYLNEQEEKHHHPKNCIPQTRQTENSLPDTDFNYKQQKRCFMETGVNTDQPTHEQIQQENPEQIQPQNRFNKTVRRLVDSFWSLKARAVDNRISKGAHEPKTRHRRIISYF